MGRMRRAEESYHGDVANFDWPGAESLEQSAPRACERKCSPCSPVEKGRKKEKWYFKKGEEHAVKVMQCFKFQQC